MRITRIRIEGFGPFKHAQEVDVTAFAADGLFLIGGETGAGKSTILDAVSYALYGDTPRWDDVNATPRFRSDYCDVADPTRVVLEFGVSGAEYRITRSPEYERPKARGIGMTVQKATALLEVRDGAGWLGLADKPRDVAEAVAGIVRLTQDEFLQVILLAQGRFHRFLLATSDERLGLLSKLFGARRFKDYQERIAERRRAMREQAEQARTEQRVLLASIEVDEALGRPEPGHELAWLDDALAAATRRVAACEAELEAAAAAQADARTARDLAERQQRRRTAEQTLLDLGEQSADIGQLRDGVDAAERAERVRPLLEARAAADSSCQVARSAVATARTGYLGDVADDDLPREVERLDRAIGALAGALTEERGLHRNEEELAALETRLDRLTTDVQADGARLADLARERAALVSLAAQRAAAEREHEEAQARLDAGTQAAEITAELRVAQQEQLELEHAFSSAQRRHADLMDQHLNGQAAAFAESLVPGEECPVCGSRTHPAPATTTAALVDYAAVEQARAEADGIGSQAGQARARSDRLRTEQARLHGLSGGGDPDSLRELLSQAQARLDDADAAQRRIADIDAEVDGDDGLHARVARLTTERDAVQAEVIASSSVLAAARERVAAQRGAYPSVADHHDALRAAHVATKALADALTAARTAEESRRTATAALDDKAAAEGFASIDLATQSLLDSDTLDEHRRLVAEHADATARVRGQLDSADLRDLPAQPVDLDEAQESEAAADRRKDDSTRAHQSALFAHAGLERHRERLRVLLERSADLAAEYEVLARLADTVAGRPPNSLSMSLESYYVAAELEEVLGAANTRLRAMTGGRYQLLHTERGILHANARVGLELEVMDENTGRARDPHTLSGGEQFLASLALALGLAEVVTARAGGVELETLFVDEGFGSLSPEYLEVAMATLDSLKSGGRTIGVISHVDAMKESIGARLDVVRTPAGWSRIDQPD